MNESRERRGARRIKNVTAWEGRDRFFFFFIVTSLSFSFLFFIFFLFFIPNLNLSLNFSARLTPEEKQQQPLAGSIFRVKNLGTTGSPAVAFHG